ncbi:hypothetical protein Tco_0808863 [Tanacetum coccineum]
MTSGQENPVNIISLSKVTMVIVVLRKRIRHLDSDGNATPLPAIRVSLNKKLVSFVTEIHTLSIDIYTSKIVDIE